MTARSLHGECTLSPSCSDAKVTNYFRPYREEFNYVHILTGSDILTEGCNAQKPTGNKYKLVLQYIN
jgi:hypothetical protein